jgi:glycosyltransferase involved in cell wall biosynthesis
VTTPPPAHTAPTRQRSLGLAHDYLLVRRGAERTFLAMADCWPGAPVHTLLYDDEVFAEAMSGRPVRVSRLNRLGIRQNGFRRLLPLFPAATERLDVADHDVIVSSSSAFAHGVRPREGAVHVCYCHSPFRYVWFERERALAELPGLAHPLARRYFDHHRDWDHRASERVTHYLANSNLTRDRIADCYGREATVVHPPVEVSRFSVGEPEDFFLTVCELVAHKRVEVALAAARLIGARVKVVGSGPEQERLRTRYAGTAEFLGRIDDTQLTSLYARARALLVTNVEEFGIAAVEAQASGRPVIATDAGGVRETVRDGFSGILVDPATPKAFAEAMRAVGEQRWDPAAIAEHARSFSTESFQRKLIAEVDRCAG